MKLNNNKGVTLIALTITIIVMLIIAGITIYGGSKLIQNAQVEDVKTNMLLVQAEVKNYVEQAKFERKTIEDMVNEGITVNGVNFKIKDSREIQGETFYKIATPMSELKLGNLKADHYLVLIKIDDVDVDVYFEPGVSDGSGTTYHLLSEM